MSMYTDAQTVANDALRMLREVSTDGDGRSRGLSDELAAGVLVAQSNAAIAAAILALAEAVKGRG